jgi:hypothetical protein
MPCDQDRDHGQAQHDDAVRSFRTKQMSVVMMAVVHVVMVAAATAMGAGLAIFAAFVERKFVAHTDIKFTHSVSIKVPEPGRL